MTSFETELTLSSQRQLVDLNQQSTNFELTFNATSLENKEFYILVADQTTLDNEDNLEFKKVSGNISGNITADKNVYQNYFLCLKSDNPCVVKINVEKTEIEPNIEDDIRENQETVNKPFFNMKTILIMVSVIAVLCLLYYFFYYKKRNENVLSSLSIEEDNPLEMLQDDLKPSVSENVLEEKPVVSENVLEEKSVYEEPISSESPDEPRDDILFQKLNSLEIE